MNVLLNVISGMSEGNPGFFDDWPGPVMLAVLGLLLIGMIVMPILTRKRQGGQINELYSNLRVGDKIMTIGGIIGTVVEIKEKSPVDKEILIKTGEVGNETILLIDIKAIYQNLTRPAAPVDFFGRPKKQDAATVAVADGISNSAKNESFNDVDISKDKKDDDDWSNSFNNDLIDSEPPTPEVEAKTDEPVADEAAPEVVAEKPAPKKKTTKK